MKPAPKNLPLKIRPVTNGDISFIFSSWLKNFREWGFMARNVPNTIYYQNHHKLIEKLIARSTVYVACNEQDPMQVFGYIVGEYIGGSFILHYIYVKTSFRKLGIGKLLYNSFDHDKTVASCCSHLTKFGERLTLKYNIIYHPYTAILDPTDLTGEPEQEQKDEK